MLIWGWVFESGGCWGEKRTGRKCRIFVENTTYATCGKSREILMNGCNRCGFIFEITTSTMSICIPETDLPGDPSYVENPGCPDSKAGQARVAFEIVNATIIGEGRHKYVVRHSLQLSNL